MTNLQPPNSKMSYRKIIKEAWQLVSHEKGLIWFGVIPSFFSTLVGICYLIYQFLAFQVSPFFGNKQYDFEQIIDFLFQLIANYPGFFVFFLILAALIGLGFFFLPPLCEGSIIGLTAAHHQQKAVSARDGLSIGLNYFLQLFEYRVVASTFGLAEFFLIFSIGARNFGFTHWLITIMCLLFLVAILFSFLFIYTQNFIVLKNKPLIPAFLESAKLVIHNFEQTFLIWLLIFLISLRVIINIFLVFLIPIFIAFVMNFLIGKLALGLGVVLAILAGLIVLSAAAYLAGILHVFTTATWTLTFLSIKHQKPQKILEQLKI